MQERQPVTGGLYRHFKNKLYQIKAVAIHSETKEKMIVYQALYGDFAVYVRPYDMFMSEVDHVKYPDVKQKYRFEQVYYDEDSGYVSVDEKCNTDTENNTATEYNTEAAAPRADEPMILPLFDESRPVYTPPQAGIKDVRTDGTDVQDSEKNKDSGKVSENKTDSEEETVDWRLMKFLDAEGYLKKLEVLAELRDNLDDKLIDAMAVSMDVEVLPGTPDERYASLRRCIQAHAKYECTRLR